MELTFEEFCAQPLDLVMHISGEKEHYLHRFARTVGVSKIVITRVGKYGGFGKSYTTYYLEGDKRNFTEPDQVYLAYMEKVCGIKPTGEEK
jgi:hypothetical protein